MFIYYITFRGCLSSLLISKVIYTPQLSISCLLMLLHMWIVYFIIIVNHKLVNNPDIFGKYRLNVQKILYSRHHLIRKRINEILPMKKNISMWQCKFVSIYLLQELHNIYIFTRFYWKISVEYYIDTYIIIVC